MFINNSEQSGSVGSQESDASLADAEPGGFFTKLQQGVRSLLCPCGTNSLSNVSREKGLKPLLSGGDHRVAANRTPYALDPLIAYDFSIISDLREESINIGKQVIASIGLAPLKSNTKVIFNQEQMTEVQFERFNLPHYMKVGEDLIFLQQFYQKPLDDKGLEAFVDYMAENRQTSDGLIANCGELTLMAARKLRKYGQKNFALIVVTASDAAIRQFELKKQVDVSVACRDFALKDYGACSKFEKFILIGGHAFIVNQLDERADISRPETWGDRAVLIDLWLGQSMLADDGLRYLNTVFEVPADERLTYSDMLQGGLFSEAECIIETEYSWSYLQRGHLTDHRSD